MEVLSTLLLLGPGVILHGCVRLCCDARMLTVGTGINTAVSRIVHLRAQNCESLLPPYGLAQTPPPQRDIHAHSGDTQGQSRVGLLRQTRLFMGSRC